MFNIGIVGGRIASASLVKITDRLLPNGGGYRQVDFSKTGPLYVLGLGSISGEWYVPGTTSEIGANYEFRYTTEVGTAPLSGGGTIGTSWTNFGVYNTLTLVWNASDSGRVLVEIRKKATGTIVASARYWTDASKAP